MRMETKHVQKDWAYIYVLAREHVIRQRTSSTYPGSIPSSMASDSSHDDGDSKRTRCSAEGSQP
jgi:hypothetical protein